MTDTANQQCTDQTAIALSVVKRAIKQFSKVPLVFDRSYFLVYLFQQGFDGNIVSLHLFDCFVLHNLFITGGHTSSVRNFIPFQVSPSASFSCPSTVQSTNEYLYFISIRYSNNHLFFFLPFSSIFNSTNTFLKSGQKDKRTSCMALS